MATADALQSPELIAEAAHALSVVLADPRSDTERRRWVAVLLGLADAHGRRDWRMWAMPIMARSECLAGRLTTACGMLEELGGPESMLLRASVSGDWNAARGAAAALRMLQAKRLFDPNAAALQEMGILGILAMHEGTAFTDGATYLEWPTDPLTWSMWAWDAASSAQSGNLDRATVLLDGVASAELSALERDGYFLPLLAMLADAAHRCGHQAVAESVAQHVEPFIGMTIVDPGLLYRGAASHAAGLVASTRGHRDAARALLNDAVELHRAHRSRWMLQRSLDALAELGLGREFFIKVQRLHVHRQRTEKDIVHFGDRARPGVIERATDREFFEIKTCHLPPRERAAFLAQMDAGRVGIVSMRPRDETPGWSE